MTAWWIFGTELWKINTGLFHGPTGFLSWLLEYKFFSEIVYDSMVQITVKVDRILTVKDESRISV